MYHDKHVLLASFSLKDVYKRDKAKNHYSVFMNLLCVSKHVRAQTSTSREKTNRNIFVGRVKPISLHGLANNTLMTQSHSMKTLRLRRLSVIKSSHSRWPLLVAHRPASLVYNTTTGRNKKQWNSILQEVFQRSLMPSLPVSLGACNLLLLPEPR